MARTACFVLILLIRGICFAGRPLGQDSCFLDVPIVKQEKDLCGAASLAMVFGYWGREISQYSIAAGIRHEPGKGLKGEDLKTYCEENGFTAFMYGGELDSLKQNIRKGRPLVVAVRSRSARLYHYIVLVGFDDGSSVVLSNDPQDGKLKRTPYGKFLSTWRRSRCWTLLIVPK